jgi:hypothetical protein
MHRSFEYSIEVWPGTVRIHHRHDEEEGQTIELSPEQIPEFCRVLQEKAAEAKELGLEFEQRDREAALRKSLSKTKFPGE